MGSIREFVSNIQVLFKPNISCRLLQEGKFCRPRNGKSNDQSHPPIHPTKLANNLQKDEEKKLYELVVRHFLACCSEDAHGFETTIAIDIANEKFTTKGLMVTATNYLDVYPYEKWSDKTIPVFNEGEQFTPTDILFHQGQTNPPNLLTESELIDLMDKNGIGILIGVEKQNINGKS